MPWTRGPSCGWRARWQPGGARAGAHADVHHPAPAVDRARHVRDHGGRVHHLLQDPGRRPGARPGRPQPEPADPGGDPRAARAQPAVPDPVRHHDEEDLHHPGPGVLLQPGRAGGPGGLRGYPATLSLVFGAAVLWVVLAIGVGIAAALLRGTVFDPLLMVVALVGVSAPVFWVGQIANMITQGSLHNTFLFSWVPPLGYTPFTQDPLLWFKGLVIPWITLSILYIGFYGRVLRANLIEGQNEDFIRTARAKGITERRVLLRHNLRTSMITF